MAKKVSNFTDLVQRVTASCLLHPLGSSRFEQVVQMTPDRFTNYPTISEELMKSADSKEEEDDDEDEEEDKYTPTNTSSSDGVGVVERSGEIYADARAMAEYRSMRNLNASNNNNGGQDSDLWALMSQVFESVSAMKKAYGQLQEAHSPWDPEKMSAADAAVVAELRRLAVLRERFRRGAGRRAVVGTAETVREVVAPYEAAVEDMKREVKAKEVEVEDLREKVKYLSTSVESGGKKSNGRGVSRKKGGSNTTSLVSSPVPSSPTPDMFESTMSKVRESSKTFTQHLLSLMRSARWDLASAVRSISSAISSTTTSAPTPTSIPRQAKYALESYVLRKIFHGFDHEAFYMDGTLTSLLNPSQFRHECFSKFKDMKSMDPTELLGILPSSPFGNFCSKKYQEIVHQKMEESLFGNVEQRTLLLNGSHPRTRFYTDFLGLAKAVWLLHLLAFALDPPPAHFEAGRGAEYHPGYMESVVRYPGGKVPSGQVVGFPVSPGFKLGNGSVVRARVYLVPRG